jgi:hypothetical protein
MKAFRAIGLLTACLGFTSGAAENPAVGVWKVNTYKSTGKVPSFVHDGILKIEDLIFTGALSGARTSRTPKMTGNLASSAAFKFELSPDRETLTLTRPGADPRFKMVFDRK